MKPEILTLVEQALAGGRYPYKCEGALSMQTIDAEITAFCFMGLLCDLSGLGEWQAKEGLVEDEEIVERSFVHDGEFYAHVVPHAVLDWAGLTDKGQDQLFKWNDAGHDDGTVTSFEEVLDTLRGYDERKETP